MKSEEKEVLKSKYKDIVNSVQRHNVVPGLVQNGILTEHDATNVYAAETNQSGMIRLMQIILNSNKRNTFEAFVIILENDQEDEHIANEIRSSLLTLKRKRLRREPNLGQREIGGAACEGLDHPLVDDDGAYGGACGGAAAEQPGQPRQRRVSCPVQPNNPAWATQPNRAVSMQERFKRGESFRRSNSYSVPESDEELYHLVIEKQENNFGFKCQKNYVIGGVDVTDIDPLSSAAMTELQTGDIIRTINSYDIVHMSDEQLVDDIIRASGKRITLGVIRVNHGVTKTDINVTLIKPITSQCGFGYISGTEWPRYKNDKLCYIHSITPEGIADNLGMQVGDSLLSVNGESLEDIDYGEVSRILQPAVNDPKGCTITLRRSTLREFSDYKL